MSKVEELLRRTTEALDAAGLDYAVIGGNAVAAWVSTIDPHAVRTTKDVDLLVRRADLDRITEALRPIGLEPAEVLGVTMFVETRDPSPKNAVHLIFANEAIRELDSTLAPDVADAAPGIAGFRVVPLLGLVKMKLLAFRLRDQTHLVDMLSIGLLDASWQDRLPEDLRPRFVQVLEAFEREQG
ncbi:MAG: hypothetical protein IT449_17070 [Phycisphaerales bacterium]|nr:hypothetical protein [Phycisphaerales bacterium]